MSAVPESTVEFALSLAESAAKVIRPYFGQSVDVETKADNSPVSIADKEAERVMREMIAEQFPDHGILGEEFGLTPNTNTHMETLRSASREPERSERGGAAAGAVTPPSAQKHTWVLDPIDGTRAFLAGGNQWGTLIALCEDSEPVLGVMHQPITGDIWLGVKNSPTLFNGEKCTTRDSITQLADAEISSTSANYFTPEQAGKFVKLADQCNAAVKDGDCIAYGLLANGARDIVIDAGLKPYDIVALVPIIQGAGGTITALDGSLITLKNAHSAVACANEALHKEVLKALL